MNTKYQPAKAWRIALLLFMFMSVNFIDKIAVGLLAVPMMDELKLTPTQFGMVASSFFWLFAIAGVAGGFLANRVATTGLLLGVALIWSLCQIPMAVSSSLVVLVVARVLLGIAEGPSFPLAVHACYKWFPDNRRAVPVAFFTQGGSIGLLLAGVTIPLITARWGWRANFYALAGVGVAWVLLWKLIGKEGSIDAETTSLSPSRRAEKIPYRKLFCDSTVLTCFMLHFIGYWALALALTWLPAYLQRGLGFGAVQSGRLFAVTVLLSMPLSLLTAWLAQRMLARGVSSRNARGRVSAATLVIAGAAFLSIWLFDLPPLAHVAVISLAIGLSPTIYSLGPAILAQITPPAQRGAILALDNSIASIAGILAPLVSAHFIQTVGGAAGYQAGFAFCGVLMVMGGLLGAFTINPDKAARSLKTAQIQIRN
ncbi:MFS transporter [Paraburkholderia sp. BCC1884]|uniref:MFS transporter n=1 Tax=Paraburkholderia sp. BCC1884 TaxID=2562668 RepID=UPI001184406E|nr:MFS transporter [Paraburkholderia sp. BCC1884]